MANDNSKVDFNRCVCMLSIILAAVSIPIIGWKYGYPSLFKSSLRCFTIGLLVLISCVCLFLAIGAFPGLNNSALSILLLLLSLLLVGMTFASYKMKKEDPYDAFIKHPFWTDAPTAPPPIINFTSRTLLVDFAHRTPIYNLATKLKNDKDAFVVIPKGLTSEYFDSSAKEGACFLSDMSEEYLQKLEEMADISEEEITKRSSSKYRTRGALGKIGVTISAIREKSKQWKTEIGARKNDFIQFINSDYLSSIKEHGSKKFDDWIKSLHGFSIKVRNGVFIIFETDINRIKYFVNALRSHILEEVNERNISLLAVLFINDKALRENIDRNPQIIDFTELPTTS